MLKKMFSITERQVVALKLMGKNVGLSHSDIVRRALDEYFERKLGGYMEMPNSVVGGREEV